jgi:hypothetical protein
MRDVKILLVTQVKYLQHCTVFRAVHHWVIRREQVTDRSLKCDVVVGQGDAFVRTFTRCDVKIHQGEAFTLQRRPWTTNRCVP